jgi:hypothetical protein
MSFVSYMSYMPHSDGCRSRLRGALLVTIATGAIGATGATGALSRRNESHLPELSKKPKEHFFGINPFVKAELPRFISVRHDIVFDIKNRFSEWPGGGVLERIVKKAVLFHYRFPDRCLIRHELCEREMLWWCVFHSKKLRQLRPDVRPTIEVSISDVECVAITPISCSRPNNRFGQEVGVGHLHHYVVGSG